MWILAHGEKNEGKVKVILELPDKTHLRGVDLLAHTFFTSSLAPLSTACWAAESTLLEGDTEGLGDFGPGTPSFSRGLGATGT